MNLRKLRKKLSMMLAAGCVAGSVFAPAGLPKAEAFGIFDAVGIGIGIAQAYDAWFSAYLEASSFLSDQNGTLELEKQRSGELSQDPREINLVNNVMEQLLDRGKYSVDSRSLPFRWEVFQTNVNNACCYYIY